MTDTPSIQVDVLIEEPSLLIAHQGPDESWDFEPLIQRVLADGPLETAGRANTGVRVVCTGLFSESTPSFGLELLTIGQLVSRNANIELDLRRLGPDAGAATQSDLPRIRVDFTLETRDDYDPKRISSLVGMEPSSQIRKGEVQSNGKPSISTRWTLSTKERQAASFDAVVEEMLSLMEPRVGQISTLTTHELDGVLSLIGYVAHRAPTVRLRLEQLRLIRDLGLAIDVDLLT